MLLVFNLVAKVARLPGRWSSGFSSALGIAEQTPGDSERRIT